jgi:RNA polymerase sigma-70 factor (ECF subfamily)
MTIAVPIDRVRDDELVTRIAAGDGPALSALFRRRHGEVYRFAVHMTASPATAEDVVQEAFLVVMRDAARYDPFRATVAAWLCGIARNCVRQRLDKDRRLTYLEPDAEAEIAGPVGDLAGPLAHLVQAERVAAIRQAVCTLPLPYREAVVLCDLQELPYAEAAAVLSCPVGTVRSRLHRARALLAGKLLAVGIGSVAQTPERQAARQKSADGGAGTASIAEVAGPGGCTL